MGTGLEDLEKVKKQKTEEYALCHGRCYTGRNNLVEKGSVAYDPTKVPPAL
jgi:hypothetical protein